MSRKKTLGGSGDDSLDDVFAEALRSVERHEKRRVGLGMEGGAGEGPESETSPLSLEETVEEIFIPEELQREGQHLDVPFATSARAEGRGESRSDLRPEARLEARIAKLEEQLRQSQHERELERTRSELLKQRTADLAKEARRLETELETAKADAQKSGEKVLWISAELENTRKRVAREKNEVERYGSEKLLRDLLPVIDNLERALQHVRERPEVQVLQEGVQMTVTQFQNCLKRHGVQRIEVKPGIPFDPTLHEAMMQEDSNALPAHSVVREMQPGYTHHERLLRATLVTVARPGSSTVSNNVASLNIVEDEVFEEGDDAADSSH